MNTSIRPGWYYHPGEDHQVKTLPRLVQTYYESIGRNGNFLLNLPVDDRGLVHENDVQQLMALKAQIDTDFAQELAQGNPASASNVRGNSSTFNAEKAIDGDFETYWATDDGTTQASITISLNEPTKVNRILLQEYIPLGQRIKKFMVSAEVDGTWQVLDEQTTVGYKRILRFETVTATQVKVDILDAKGPITLSTLELYNAPPLLVDPKITRNRDGMVSIEIPDDEVDVYVTTDGMEPTTTSKKYDGPFPVLTPTNVKAIAVDPNNRQQTQTVGQYFDLAKKDWKVVGALQNDADLVKLMDDDPNTFWATDENASNSNEITIDLGASHTLTGFSYWPIQERYPFGIITKYDFLVSQDNRTWKSVSKGEFSNVVNNRIEQKINFYPTLARYIKLKALEKHNGDGRTSFAEIGVFTTNQ